MVSPELLRRVRDALFREFVLPGDTGFWGVGIGRDEVILYLDSSRAKRVVNVPSTYVVDGEVVRVRIVEARMPRALA
ncbi:hypothetical protein [Vulcanisaeta sp. JCM 14467]|uniref:hypothetical protein n=1 Tax=Vulcanisaeta sp. JCM 14467 TaxID=1295370 RepID=UPI0006CFE30D|nr:hypothetical protein [Vulcanisaeta sp. JCM 14467]